MTPTRIARNTVVRIDYTLKDPSGEVLDTSDGDEPLTYLHGHGQLVPGLERALEGRSTGAEFDVVVAAGDGYGAYDATRVVRVPRQDVPPGVELLPGAPVHAENEDGEVVEFTVVSVSDKEVVLDGNHRLAGVDLHFRISVRGVRVATAEEVAHGHAHDGAHHH